jgi:hypothetical protein
MELQRHGAAAGGGGLADPGANGVVVRNCSKHYWQRTSTAGTGISVTNGTGVSGNPTIAPAANPVVIGLSALWFKSLWQTIVVAVILGLTSVSGV